MAIKTFNIDDEIYKEFSRHCKKEGVSMSKRVENFIRSELERMKFDKARAPSVKEHSFKRYC